MFSTNQRNVLVLVALGASIVFSEHLSQYLAGSIFGVLASYLFLQIKQFGFKQAFYAKRDPRSTNVSS